MTQFGDAELVFTRDFPQKSHIDIFSQTMRTGDHFCSGGSFELQQHITRPHLGALSRWRLDLISLTLLAQYRAHFEIAGLFEEQIHSLLIARKS